MADLNIQGIASASATMRGELIEIAPGHGFETWLGFGQELTYGSVVARTKFIEIVSESIKLARAPIPKASLRGRFVRGFFQGRKVVAGDIETELFFEGHEWLLKQAFGKVTTTTVEAGVYDHVFEPFTPLPTGLTLEVFRDIKAFLYPGGKVNSLALSMVLDQVMRATYSVGAADESLIAGTSPSFPTELLPVFHAADVKVDSISEEANDFNVTLNNNLALERFKLNSVITKEPALNDISTVEGSFTGDFLDIRQYTKFTGGTAVALQMVVVGEAIPATASFYTLTIDIPRAVYTGETPSVGGPGIIPQNFPFMGFRSEDLATPAIKLTLRNTISSV